MAPSGKAARPRIIAVAGGSCSGKTTLARALAAALGPDRASILYQDSYYLDRSREFDRDGGSVNFDHPESLDFELLARHLDELRSGRPVEVPLYEFATHRRLPRTEPFEPRETILVDGILILAQTRLRPLFDDSVFVEAPEDLRFHRRLERDVRERGREAEGVRRQFFNHVKPMHDLHVEPSKHFAGVRLSGADDPDAVLEACLKALGLR